MRTRPDLVPRRIRRPGMFAGGDGSTLSLDFTSMSGLDSRFTFSRASTATVINSSGLVQYADHNLVANSAFAGFGMGTGWVQNGAAATNSGTGTLTFSVTTAAISYASRSISTASGLQYSAAVNVSSITGTIQYQEVLAIAGTISSTQFYRNGVAVSASATAQPGLISITWTSGGSNFIRFGVGASGSNQTNVTVAVDTPRAIAGAVAQPAYFASTATDPYHAPRFDYDPTTLAPRGLLIEGSVTNLVTQSEAFTTGAGNWTDSNITRDGTLRTSPDGTANALRITASAGNATIIRTSAIGTSAARTFSIWLRRVTGTGNIDYTQNNGANWNTQAITSSWVRYTFTHTANHQVGIRIVTSGDAIELWGAQLETGSGASSYIPTGSGTVQRAADSCSIAASASWLNTASGTFVVNSHRGDFGSQDRVAFTSDYASGRWLGVFNISNTVYLSWWNGSINRTTGSTINKTAYTYGQTTGSGATLQLPVRLCVNASSVATGTFGNGTTNGADVPNPVNWTNFVIGAASSAAPYTTANRDFLNNCVRSVKYWPTVLPDAQLQALTQ